MKDASKQRWNLDHDPEARPLGCNGRYGKSGVNLHRYHKTPYCDACKASARHYEREVRRGQKYPRVLRPCGTRAAAERHRNKGEELCWPCKIAENEDWARRAKMGAHQSDNAN